MVENTRDCRGVLTDSADTVAAVAWVCNWATSAGAENVSATLNAPRRNSQLSDMAPASLRYLVVQEMQGAIKVTTKESESSERRLG